MATERNLERYQGALTPHEAADGINAARRNGCRLLEDAKRLFEAQRYPSALFLCILAIEEMGKVQHIRGILVSDNDADVRRHWRRFRTHTAKNGLWLLRSHAETRSKHLFHEVAWLAASGTEHAQLAEDVKQVSAYVDRYGDRCWSEPVAVVDKDLAESFLRSAEILVSKRETSARAMELWLEHIGPARKSGRTVEAARAWNDAMVAEGLKEDDRGAWASFLGLNDDEPEPD